MSLIGKLYKAITVTEQNINVHPKRSLNAKWSLDIAQDLQAFHGIDVFETTSQCFLKDSGGYRQLVFAEDVSCAGWSTAICSRGDGPACRHNPTSESTGSTVYVGTVKQGLVSKLLYMDEFNNNSQDIRDFVDEIQAILSRKQTDVECVSELLASMAARHILVD